MAYIIQTHQQLKALVDANIINDDDLHNMKRGIMKWVGKGVLVYPWDQGAYISISFPLK